MNENGDSTMQDDNVQVISDSLLHFTGTMYQAYSQTKHLFAVSCRVTKQL